MAETPHSTETTDTPIEPPDWSAISEEIHCPLCSYNLRGLIEPRCPECGYRFAWPELLDPEQRLHPFAYEHHPEKNLWSAWKTSFALYRPRRFWKSLHPIQPANAKRLIHFWLYTVIPMLGFVAAGTALLTIRYAQIEAANNAWTIQNYQAALRGPNKAQIEKWMIENSGSVSVFLAHFDPVPNYRLAFSRAAGTIYDAAAFPLIVLLWPWLSILGFGVYGVTMRKKTISGTHVMRCVLYNQDILGFLILPFLLHALWRPAVSSSVSAFIELFEAGCLFVALVIFGYRMTMAYKYYLRFDSPVVTVFLAQIITALSALILLSFPLYFS